MISKLSIAACIVGLSLIAYNKSNTLNSNREIALKNEAKCSIGTKNGKFHIDSIVIFMDRNKGALLRSVQTESLDIRSTYEEIPQFIREFLDNNSQKGKFEIVNPGEDWKCGITNFGHTIVTKYYDPQKMDTVRIIYGDGQVLPNKQLAYFGIGKSVALFSYYDSDYGSADQKVVMIKHQDQKIIDFWYRGYGFSNESSDTESLKITTKAEIIKTLKSKRVTNGC